MQVKILQRLKYPKFNNRSLMSGSETLEAGIVRDWPVRYATEQIESGNVEAATVTPKQDEPEAVEVDATDSARELAEENGLDLGTVTGTGSGGRILKSDVEAAISNG
jgi:pyruvate/2-oxoglutarate dehydrogenase complex dihydrolipoamide acyltransferase (E2) component